MYLPGDKLKGLKTLLSERELWPKDGLKLEEARALLANQPDFRAQRAWMAEAVEQAGHLIDFYSKFHCELNPIERMWGAAKRWTRENCEYKLAKAHAPGLGENPTREEYQAVFSRLHDSILSL